jgi:hypothetical protein
MVEYQSIVKEVSFSLNSFFAKLHRLRHSYSFIDFNSGWPEAFAVPDKSADQICNLLIDEIFSRRG